MFPSGPAVMPRGRLAGVGIDPPMLPQVFELFHQVDPAAARSQGGLGIGLALVLIRVINRRAFGWSIETVIPVEVLLQAVGLAVLAALAAGIYPAWRMSRTPPAPALREE